MKPLTAPMLRELRAIAFDGNPSDPLDWQHAPDSLWFYARDKVIGALLTRQLICDDGIHSGYSLTDLGRAVLAKKPAA